MLEDIGKIPKVKETIERAIVVVGFNHVDKLNMMREFTNKKELVRHGATRFTTTFVTLQQVHLQKQSKKHVRIGEVGEK